MECMTSVYSHERYIISETQCDNMSIIIKLICNCIIIIIIININNEFHNDAIVFQEDCRAAVTQLLLC